MVFAAGSNRCRPRPCHNPDLRPAPLHDIAGTSAVTARGSLAPEMRRQKSRSALERDPDARPEAQHVLGVRRALDRDDETELIIGPSATDIQASE